ncbi:MAG: D-glycero-beta-D-manno-heptose 1-phosphate adenylyltransferase [Thermodesulfobacteriota bacterium]
MTGFSYLGFCQFDVALGAPEINLGRLAEGLARLAPREPGLVVLPELLATGFAYRQARALAARTPELLRLLTGIANRYRLHLAGSLLEASPAGLHNTLFLVGPDGVLGRIAKRHLFAPMDEDRHLVAGPAAGPLATPHGLVAGLVCYELRFPELARLPIQAGARILVVVAQWPRVRLSHWQTLVRARAIENQAFVLAGNRCGSTGMDTFAGHSQIIAPDGTVLAEAGEGEEARGVLVDPQEPQVVRARFNTVGPRPYGLPDAGKVVDRERAASQVAEHRAAGSRIVFTNGCFDLLHAGHVQYLEEARRQGDFLVVGLNSDASVAAIKGPGRPVNTEADRARVLAALGCVDLVVLFGETTPLALIEALRPQVLVKGADWAEEAIVGAPQVQAWGGQVVRIPLLAGRSTSGLIERIGRGPGEKTG